ncbi:Ig-like domain-containing protein [Solirubrobacter ginsenosidimutans]|uniref:Ig-like domain-containing protein n=1 Tax=Solirubrobacter ginsenosidimutans TaxID=490573 RepID=A0A9X3MXD2_9ACTN|nr:Ig-like domain-containing protein [Solirubrobacter ginsenosidimutans]MDA0162922.1 Ig-like domain-containing protein [Solirubrobacter ginsenosidimutans]
MHLSQVGAAAWIVAALALFGAPAVAAADDQTTTTVTTPATQPAHGQTATLTATVDDTTTPAAVPLGSVQFSLDGAPIGSPVALSGHSAQLQTGALRTGTHPVLAKYLPAPGFLGSDGSTSLTVIQATTTTLLRVTPDTTGVAGQDIAIQTTVGPANPLGPPTGSVSYFVNGVRLGDAALDNGVSRRVVELPAFAFTLVAVYPGDGNYTTSSGSASVSVNQAGTVIALTASPNPVVIGQPVAFSLFVNSLDPSNWWPSGVLSSAVDGQAVPGAITLDGDGSTVGFTRTFATAGVHHVTAHFTGDDDFLASDAALDETVTPLTTTPASTRPAAPRALSIKVAPKRDRQAPYRFTVSGTLQLPSTVAKAEGCGGKVTIDAKLKAKRVARKTVSLNSACQFKTTLTAPRKGSISITAAFAGTATIAAVKARAVRVTAG